MREQRLSFISTSTGYSSTRSSLRSSDIGDDYHLSHEVVTSKKLLSFVSHYINLLTEHL